MWSYCYIKVTTKTKVYNSAVQPSLLYSTETMTLYQRHVKELTRIHLQHLLQILRKWQEKLPDVEVLNFAETDSIESITTVSQLHWAGHVRRMSDERLPKAEK